MDKWDQAVGGSADGTSYNQHLGIVSGDVVLSLRPCLILPYEIQHPKHLSRPSGRFPRA